MGSEEKRTTVDLSRASACPARDRGKHPVSCSLFPVYCLLFAIMET